MRIGPSTPVLKCTRLQREQRTPMFGALLAGPAVSETNGRDRMAQHRSAQKRARQAEKRRERNRAVRSRVRGSTRAVRAALEGGDLARAQSELREAEKVIRRAASKGIVKKTTASRTVSRLAKAVHRAAGAK